MKEYFPFDMGPFLGAAFDGSRDVFVKMGILETMPRVSDTICTIFFTGYCVYIILVFMM